MAKKLLVRTPQTADGISPLLEDDRVVYKETLVPLEARRGLESINAALAETHASLQHKIEEVEVDERGQVIKVPKAKKDEAK